MNLYKENDLYVPEIGQLTYHSMLAGYGKDFDFVASIKRHLECSGGLSIPRKIHYVCKEGVFLNGVPHAIPFNVFENYFTSLETVLRNAMETTSENTATREETAIVRRVMWVITYQRKLARSANASFSLNAAVISLKKVLMRLCAHLM